MTKQRRQTTSNDTYQYLRYVDQSMVKPYLRQILHQSIHPLNTRTQRGKKGNRV